MVYDPSRDFFFFYWGAGFGGILYGILMMIMFGQMPPEGASIMVKKATGRCQLGFAVMFVTLILFMVAVMISLSVLYPVWLTLTITLSSLTLSCTLTPSSRILSGFPSLQSLLFDTILAWQYENAHYPSLKLGLGLHPPHRILCGHFTLLHMAIPE